ncbi:MAG TPA: hypothetical protein IGS37_11470 [Synechococcales cyanobacterium M55_K2018_004]|nr:hypothetical protein [Synechococcales cyanobacterium M55_K2018_004]
MGMFAGILRRSKFKGVSLFWRCPQFDDYAGSSILTLEGLTIGEPDTGGVQVALRQAFVDAIAHLDCISPGFPDHQDER